MRKRHLKIFSILLLLAISLVFYIVWENNRVIIKEDTILTEGLTNDEEFSILQVTDLHEKEFGENQRRLIKAINSVEYDAIVFTGDMLDDVDSRNYDSFYKLIEGIQNKENAFFTEGNTDPERYKLTAEGNLVKNEFVQGMEKRGVDLLESIIMIKNKNSNIYLLDFELSLMTSETNRQDYEGRVMPSYALLSEYRDYEEQLLIEMSTLDSIKDSDIVVALNHYPVADARIEAIQNSGRYELRDYDVILAGHYHGGQIRIPFLGALFIPEPWYDRGGFLPPQDRVKGLWEYKGIKQYVSAGLGSSDAISFLNFRFNNPPEINIITLTNGQ
ncbi:metallophosphoesterase [Guptibacillus sedimenti]|uniref:metallophosphoesterase n=1 Tax=Guptibacillus sedimenti TaxID=3025680 RepID=UPI00235F9637|nr:metallophosphoesterase [Pseudalkalibacillus sedimenti]